MSYKEQLVSQVRQESSAILANEKGTLESVVKLFCAIEEPPIYMDLVIMRGTHTRSRKAGNIRLNWRQFFERVPTIVLTGAGGAASRLLLPFAALAIWNHVWKLASIEISPRDAIALEAMWNNRNSEYRITKTRAYNSINEKLQAYKFEVMSVAEIERTLDTLSNLECLEIESEEIRLCERVKSEI